MRIGLVLANLPGYSETFFRNKILGLQQSGHEVVLYVNAHDAEHSYLGCKVKRAPRFNGNKILLVGSLLLQLVRMLLVYPLRSFRLYQLNKKDKIPLGENLKQILANQFLLSAKLDWLHFGFGTMALGRENIAQVIGAQMAVSFRGYDYYVYPLKHPNCYSTLFSKKVKYHVLSNAMKSGLEEHKIPSANIVKITPSIDGKLFNFSSHEIKNPILQLKTVSRLHYIKGLDYILRALAILKKQDISFHFTIIGDGKEKERLLFAVHQLGLSQNVTFTGKLSPTEVREELSNTDIYLQYSIQEGFCNAVLEAQAMGLLCIVSDAEGLRENVLDNQTGWVVRKRNPELLAQKIMEVMNLDATKKDIIQEQAIARVHKDFNLEQQQQDFVAFYTN